MSTAGNTDNASGEEVDRTVSNEVTVSSVDGASGAAHTDTPDRPQPDLRDLPNIDVDEVRTLDNGFLDGNQSGN
jgi:hypothetical protein